MTLFVLLMALASMLVGEKIQAGNGLGWDGTVYGGLVRGMDATVADGKLSAYYAQRLLPAALVRAAMLLLRLPFTDANIIRTFEVYNAVLAVGATLLWARIANRLRLGVAARWLGFSALFVTYAFSKQNFFYPVLTDMTAYVAGLLLLLFSLEGRRIALLATTVTAAFCWPIAVPSGGALLLLANTRGEALWYDAGDGRPAALLRARPVLVVLGVGLALYLAAVVLTTTGQACPVVDRAFRWSFAHAPAVLQRKLTTPDACAAFASLLTAIPVVVLFGTAILWLGAAGLRASRILGEVQRIRMLDLACCAVAIIVPWIGVKLLSNPAVPNPSSLFLLVHLSLIPTVGMVFMPLVSLGVFWGPMVLMIVLRWHDFSRAARRLGPGVVALLCLNIPFGVVGEPRFLTLAWPFLATVMACALDQRPLRRDFGYAFASLSIVFAQSWLPLNYARWGGDDANNLLVLPKQLYFMHYGLWMSWPGYVLQATALLLAGGWLWTVYRRQGEATAPPEPRPASGQASRAA